jgi:tetratricopeptide (TPR) repeat protein
MGGPFFRRFVAPDANALRAEIAQRRDALAAARARGTEDVALIEALGWLGTRLVMAGDEADAAPLLEEALALSRKLGHRETEIDGLLALGTAVQYLAERDRAQALFAQGLALCAATGLRRQENFLWHHAGRCYVEQGRLAEARTAFENALALREAIGDARMIQSTRDALDELRRTRSP